MLNDRIPAWVPPVRASTAAVRSLVDVLPTLPVIPTTWAPVESRAAAPSVLSATAVSGTRMAVPGPAGPEVRWAPAPASIAASMKSWPSRSATSGTNRQPGVVARES